MNENKLLVVRAAGNGLSTLVRTFERPMGLAVDARRLTQYPQRTAICLICLAWSVNSN